MSIGKDIVAKMKSPFADDETVARWIDHSVERAVEEAKLAEQVRIEKFVARLSTEEFKKVREQCQFLHSSKGCPNG